MKVLAISSSPRIGGNSDILCDRFLEGAKESGHETEKINVSKKNITPCFACDVCQKTGKCFKNDDMEEILEKMIAADVIVLATPVYFYSLSAQMKMVIDRCYSKFMQIKGKKFYYVITAAEPDNSAAEETIAAFRGFLRCLPDAEECGIIYGTGAWNKGDITKMNAVENAYEAGKNI